jgi:hypothetical protein
MFQKSQSKKTGLDIAIDDLLAELKGLETESEDFATAVSHIETLYELKLKDKPDRVSRDVLVTVAGNLAGILLIVQFERLNVVTTKALSLLLKTKTI